MITEHALLNIKNGQAKEFEAAFEEAQKIITSMNGYVSHELLKCMESENQYLLLVKWKTLDDHMVGFRGSEQYQEWKALLHHFYDPFPEVLHFDAF